MKKILLFVAVTTASFMASAQAPSPYPYASFKKHDNLTPTYSVPDAAIASPTALQTGVSLVNTQALGLQCINFDQASASTASSYAGDYLKTCGPTPTAYAETAASVTVIRTWALSTDEFSAGTTYNTVKEPWLGLNSNPQTFRYSGGWYYYTVNFTEATEYVLFLRLRSGTMQATKTVQGASQTVDKIVTVQLYDKSDMANPLNTWTLNYAGISVSSTTVTSPSSNRSVAFHSWAKGVVNVTDPTKFDPTVGQAASFWSKAAATYTIPAVGEYVIKISDPALKIEGQDAASAAGDANNAIGSFTFIKKTSTGINNVNTVNATATAIGREVKLSSNVQSVEVYNLTGSKLKSGKIEGNQFRIESAGVYLLKLITAEGSKIQKIVLR